MNREILLKEINSLKEFMTGLGLNKLSCYQDLLEREKELQEKYPIIKMDYLIRKGFKNRLN